MLKFNCFICKKQLKEAGAILFSPPIIFDYKKIDMPKVNCAERLHICVNCYPKVIKNFYSMNI